MAVSLTVSRTFQGSQVNDSLLGGGSGVDLGTVSNGAYTPLTDQSLNQGQEDLYISHDGTNEITDVKTYIAQYSGVYGGDDTAANDYSNIVSFGNTSGNSKNNNDGASAGLWIDMDRDASDANNFDQANFPAIVKIYGDNNTDGIDLASAFTVGTTAMARDNGGEDDPTAPVAGEIGPSGNQVLGEAAHVKLRFYLKTSETQGGAMQFDWVIVFSATT